MRQNAFVCEKELIIQTYGLCTLNQNHFTTLKTLPSIQLQFSNSPDHQYLHMRQYFLTRNIHIC